MRLILLLLILLTLTGCQNKNNDNPEVNIPTLEIKDTNDIFNEEFLKAENPTYINLNANSNGSNFELKDNQLLIGESGTFELTKTLNGIIMIDADKDDIIHLILNNATIINESSAAIYIKKANKVYIELKNENYLETKNDFIAFDENNIDGVIFSKKPVVFGGEGKLTITSSSHAIVVKDCLYFDDGNYNLTTKTTAITSNEVIKIKNGNFNINSNGNGMQAIDNSQVNVGDIYVQSAIFNITSTKDGIEAGGNIQLNDGTFEMLTGLKGIKATNNIAIMGGEYQIDSDDDAIHSNGNIEINGGTFEIITKDDGIHTDKNLVINCGTINIQNSYEGLEGINIVINDGEIEIISSDDGINAAGGNDQSGFGGPFGGGMMDADSNAIIQINGGYILINANGDGIDSNGYIEINGGEIFIDGPANGGNGSLDYGIAATINNGIFVATCVQGMNTNFSQAKQGSILLNVTSTNSNLILTDSSNVELITFTPAKIYSSIIISAPSLEIGKSYTINAGSNVKTITLTNYIYGSSNGMGGPGGGPGGRPR